MIKKMIVILAFALLCVQADETKINSQKIHLLQQLDEALKNSNLEKIFTTYKELADLSKSNGEYYKATKYYKLAIKIHRILKTPSKDEKVKLYQNLAYSYKKLGDTFKSFKYTYQAVQLAESIYGENSTISKNLKKEITSIQSRLIASSI